MRMTNDECTLKKHSRLGVYHLWLEDGGRRVNESDYVCIRTLERLGIQYDMSMILKIDGMYWLSSDSLSEDEYTMVEDYYRYVETKDEALRSRLNDAIETNVVKQEEDWSGDRLVRLMELEEDNPAKDAWVGLLMDDDFVDFVSYPLLVRKKSGEKYLL